MKLIQLLEGQFDERSPTKKDNLKLRSALKAKWAIVEDQLYPAWQKIKNLQDRLCYEEILPHDHVPDGYVKIVYRAREHVIGPPQTVMKAFKVIDTPENRELTKQFVQAFERQMKRYDILARIRDKIKTR